MKKTYEIIDSQVAFKGKVIDVKLDTISLPDGNTAKREVVLRGDATAVVPIDKDGNVVLVEQYRHPALSMVLEIPAGMLEKGEDPKECAIRELEEEGRVEERKSVRKSVKIERKEKVLELYNQGTEVKEIAMRLDVSVVTIKTYIKELKEEGRV